jgi:ATP-binding cassette, subfamily C, bacterial CydCD
LKLDKRLLRLIQSSKISLYLIIALGLAGGVLTVLHARTLSRIIAQVFLRGASLAEVVPLISILAALIILRSSLLWISETSASRLAIRVKSELRLRLFKHIQQLGPYYSGGDNNQQHRRTGELVNTALDGIESLDAYISQYLPQLALAALVPLTLLIFIFPLDPLSGLVLLLTAPLIPLFMILIGGLANSLTRRQWKTLSRLSAHFLDVIQGLTTLKIFGRSRAQIEVIAKITDRYRHTTLGVLRVAFLSALVLELVATLSTAVVAVQIGLRLLYGYIEFEAAFFVLLLAPEFYLPLRILGTRFHAGMAGVTAAKRIFEILDTPIPSQYESFNSQPTLPSPPISISFKNVRSTYPDGHTALNGISFDVFAGQKVALVGPSGAGKSTISRLLLRFLELDSGSIFLNSLHLNEIPLNASRQLISWVPQNPYIFHDTIMENIHIARPDASKEDVIAAANLAHAHEFIERLPNGYDTIVGERGQRLSGGQVQRVALARAFLKDAPILILDEATANLDPEHAILIEESTNRLMAGRTCLIIAHRLNTIVNTDLILVLDEGRLVESGTHPQLLHKVGLYQQLIEARAERKIDRSKKVIEGDKSQLQALDLQLPVFDTQVATIDPLSTPPIRPTLRHLITLLNFLVPFKGLIALSILLGFITIASGIGLMATSAYIISAAALQPSIAILQVPIVGVRAFGVARGVFRYLERYVSHDVAFRILARMRVWFYQALEPLAPARLIHYRSGDLLSRVIADINTLENFYLRAVSPPLVATLVVLLITLLMYLFHPSLAIATMTFFMVAGIFLPIIILGLNHKSGGLLLGSRADLHVAFIDAIQGMADLQAFSGETRHSKRVADVIRSLTIAQQRLAWVGGMQTASVNLLSHLAAWTILILAIPLVRQGTIQGVYLPVLVLAALTSFEAILPLPLAAQHFDGSLQAARRLLEVIDTPPAVCDPDDPLPLEYPHFDIDPSPPKWGKATSRSRKLLPPSIELKHISFSYAADETPALQDINFTILPGQCKAIVGPSGAGKTTLVNLLLRFWDYQQGQILLNDIDLRHFDQNQVRQIFAVVSQHTHLFNATIRDNLIIANPQATQSELVRATTSAQIHDVIQKLPQGYESWIGEEGFRLSGGERQRLAIARAFLKNAPMLILDEFTANLDTITEQRVLQAARALMVGRSTLIISHHLDGLGDTDEILVLKDGCLIERGRHEGLINKRGLYWRMWEAERNAISSTKTP